MKCKIAFITLFVVLFNSISVYCYDDVKYYVSPHSGTVAVSGAVASSLLALATKVGVEFATSDEMENFIREMISDVNGVSIMKTIAKTVATVGAGVIGLPASVVASFCNYVNSKSIKNLSVTSVKVKDIHGVEYSIPVVPRKFDDTSIYGNAGVTYLKKLVANADYSIAIDFKDKYDTETNIFEFPGLSFGFKSTVASYFSSYVTFGSGSPGTNWETGIFGGSSYSWSGSGNSMKCIPFLEPVSNNSLDFFLKGALVQYNPTTGVMFGDLKVLVPGSYYSFYEDVMLEGAPSDSPVATIPSDIVESPGSVSIGIPLNTNDLIGKSPSDITDSPSYELWMPNTVVVPPAISSEPSIDYTPDFVVPDDTVDIPLIDNPGDSVETPGDSDTPGDNVDTDSPNAWNWLKELLEKLLDFIKSIVDWLTGFWDKLAEFLISLLVPDDRYFVDSLSEIIDLLSEKIPSIDIYKLHSLAVGETKFEDIYANFFGVKCLVVKGSVINNIVPWIRAIGQGIVGLFLLLYNYNQIYQLIRGGALYGNNYIKISDKG